MAECTVKHNALLAIRMQSAAGISEVLGQTFVDSVLELGSQRIQAVLRNVNQAYTLAVNEFVLLLDVVGASNARRTAQLIVDVVQRPYIVRGQLLYLNAFIGVSMASTEGTQHAVLLSQARSALKAAAEMRPGTINFFNERLNECMDTQQMLAAELRKALPLRQFEIHYQPQVQLPKCPVVGFEALLRWKHPTIGWISPVDFIPIAEEIGVIEDIGSWVLQTACHQAAQLPHGITMAVNVSPLQLQNGSFPEAVGVATAGAGLPPERLQIESTEGLLLERSDMVRSALEDLHAIGVKLAIDDFGSGYSSLGQLAHLPFDSIKIDRSLVGTSAKKRAVVRAIAMLGLGLGMPTLIEGIENEEALAFACNDQCTFAQGFLFGHPVPAAQLHDLLLRLNPMTRSLVSPL